MRGKSIRRFKQEVVRFVTVLLIGASLTLSTLVVVCAFAWLIGWLLGVKIN